MNMTWPNSALHQRSWCFVWLKVIDVFWHQTSQLHQHIYPWIFHLWMWMFWMSFSLGLIHLNMIATLTLSSASAFAAAERNWSHSSLNLFHWLDTSEPSWIGIGTKKSTLILILIWLVFTGSDTSSSSSLDVSGSGIDEPLTSTADCCCVNPASINSHDAGLFLQSLARGTMLMLCVYINWLLVWE